MGFFKWIRNGANPDKLDYDSGFMDEDTDEDFEAVGYNTYTCKQCGASFVLDDAKHEFENHFHGDLEYEDMGGLLCGDCAIDVVESYCGENADYDEDGESVGCIACGNPAYPDCVESCRLFDD